MNDDTLAEESVTTTAAPPSHRGIDALTGWRRRVWQLQAAYVGLGIRHRLPVRLLIAPFRRVGAQLEDPTLLPAMAGLVPDGIVSDLDLGYGPDPAMLLDVHRPRAAGALPVIVWTHGGGWVGGTKNDLRSFLRVLAGFGFVTVGVDYSWAPERRYPTQVEQVAAALAHVRDNAPAHGIDPERIVLAGDSAGAHITAQVARSLTDPDYARRAGIRVPDIDPAIVRAVVLTSGPFSISGVDDPGGMGRLGDFLLRAYTGVRAYADDPVVRCASLVDDLDASFPPAFISAGTVDPMLADSRMLAQRLTALGVPVVTAFYPDDHEPELPHEFGVDLRRPEAQEVLDAIVRFAHRHVTTDTIER